MNVPLDNSTALRHDMFQGWMASPNTRSTADVLWTCLATIFLCVYTAVHLNLPEPGEPEWRQILRRTKWVMLAILAPEVVLQCAWKQYADARYVQDNLKKEIRRRRDGSGNLESVVTEDANGSRMFDNAVPLQTSKLIPSENITEVSDIPLEENITMTYAFYAIMGGFRIRSPHQQRSYSVSPEAFLGLAQEGIFWNVSTTSITDRSKADNLAKFLTVIQVMWMLVQCIARKATNLPLTLLEIHTFIHAICAFIMFLLWFKKPLNVRDATIRTIAADNPALRKLELLSNNKKTLPALTVRSVNMGRGWGNDSTFIKKQSVIDVVEVVVDGDDFGYFKTDSYQFTNLAGLTLIQVVYGCLHASAWNMLFPSQFEMWAWRASCIAIAASFACFMATLYVTAGLGNKIGNNLEWVIGISFVVISVVLLVAWIFARVFVVVESIIGLRSVPIGVYAAISWSTYVPHI